MWKDAANAPKAAEAMGVTASQILKQGLIDEVLTEPVGGAHTAPIEAIAAVKTFIATQLSLLAQLPLQTLLDQRYERLMTMGLN